MAPSLHLAVEVPDLWQTAPDGLLCRPYHLCSASSLNGYANCRHFVYGPLLYLIYNNNYNGEYLSAQLLLKVKEKLTQCGVFETCYTNHKLCRAIMLQGCG